VPLRSLGLFGGSFDPVHSGHVLLARHAREALGLDEVWFMPCSRSADGKSLAPGALRLRWLNKALLGESGLKASDLELKRGGISRTIDTLRELRTLGPALKLTLLLGADQARRLPRWKEAARIPALARVVVFRRPGIPAKLPKGLRCRTLRAPMFDVSSSEIRASIRRRGNLGLLVPPALVRDASLKRFYGRRVPVLP
jgi:nicotinate-nucleotide adenylyltransferase